MRLLRQRTGSMLSTFWQAYQQTGSALGTSLMR